MAVSESLLRKAFTLSLGPLRRKPGPRHLVHVSLPVPSQRWQLRRARVSAKQTWRRLWPCSPPRRRHALVREVEGVGVAEELEPRHRDHQLGRWERQRRLPAEATYSQLCSSSCDAATGATRARTPVMRASGRSPMARRGGEQSRRLLLPQGTSAAVTASSSGRCSAEWSAIVRQALCCTLSLAVSAFHLRLLSTMCLRRTSLSSP